jgi:hypothetical protein
MACHELAGLRIGLMNVIGIDDEAELKHELAELGTSATEKGPIQELTKAHSLASLLKHYESSLVGLEEKVAKLKPNDPKLGYYKTLIVTTKKVELDLRNHMESLKTFYENLEEVHDFIHEIYPE